MSVFLVTLLAVSLCCLLLGVGLVIDRRPLKGGCGHKPPGAPRCANCPNAGRAEAEQAGRDDRGGCPS